MPKLEDPRKVVVRNCEQQLKMMIRNHDHMRFDLPEFQLPISGNLEAAGRRSLAIVNFFSFIDTLYSATWGCAVLMQPPPFPAGTGALRSSALVAGSQHEGAPDISSLFPLGSTQTTLISQVQPEVA